MMMPLYINVIRDPIERAKSHFYYHIFGSFSAPYDKTDLSANKVNINILTVEM